jgi:NADPH-dependent glutamate synthase beta subunit-like oxidoreductase
VKLNDAQVAAEVERCAACTSRSCVGGCPADVSPADFIVAARGGAPAALGRAAALILAHNPLGGACGEACPETLCMARCVFASEGRPVEIPALQAAIVRGAAALGVLPRFAPQPATGHRIAVVGAGPAGLGAASVLAKAGHAVTLLDRARSLGGTARLIPRGRLDPALLEGDLSFLLGLGAIEPVLGRPVALPRDLLARGFAAVVVAGGRAEPVALDVPGGERAIPWARLLGPRPPALRGKRVAVVGGGRVALDCAQAARSRGASRVELVALESRVELERALDRAEREWLRASGVAFTGRARVTRVRASGSGRGAKVAGLALHEVELPAGVAFHPGRVFDRRGARPGRRDVDVVIAAIGGAPSLRREPHPRIFYAGDLETGPSTVVEALASGKRAALEVHRLLSGSDAACPDRSSCADGAGCPRRATCAEWNPPRG